MYFVYRFLDKKKNIIYVGKSKQNLEARFKGHSHLPDECYKMVYKIEYIECSTESDMSIKEIYYINKYKGDSPVFYNILDMTEKPESIVFEDKWRAYKGPLSDNFPNSLNFKKGYTKEQVTKYNQDGTIDKRKNNKQKGISSYVEALTKEEVDRMLDYMIDKLNNAENDNQEQIRFRNIVMLIVALNLPMKADEYLSLKYKDIFDQNDNFKLLEYNLGRFQKDEIIHIPLRTNIKNIMQSYVKKYGLTYANSSEDDFFTSRKHQIVDPKTWWRILNDVVDGVKLNKNIGVETTRKTYGLTIYKKSKNKLNALLFLGEIWGRSRESQVIRYLGLTNEEIDYEYYFGDTFAIGDVDLAKIKCLQKSSKDEEELAKNDGQQQKKVLWEPVILRIDEN